MRRRIPYIILSALLIALVAAQARLCSEAARIIPNAVLLENADGLGITVAEYLERSDLSVSAAVTEAGRVSAGAVGVTAELTYIDSRFGGLIDLHMLNGAFFPDGEYAAAVISERLATELYFSLDILGAELDINGETFYVCGVYREETSTAVRLSGNGREDVYLPLNAYPNKTAQLRQIYSYGDVGFVNTAMGRAVSELETPLNAEKLTDYGEANRLAVQSGELMVFELGCFIVLTAIAALCRELLTLIREVSSSVRDSTGTLKLNKARTTSRAVLCLLYIVAAAVVLWFVSFEAYLPAEWLQGGLNAGKFFERFVSETHKLNAAAYSFYNEYVRRVLLCLYTLDVLVFAAGAVLTALVIRRRKS